MTVLRTFSFPLPATPLTMNQRLHWRPRNALTVAWRGDTAWHAIAKCERTALPPCTVDIAIPVRGAKRRDPHNWTPTCKAVVDGLVDARWWPDDNSTWVTVLEPTLVVGGDVVTVTARERA